ncbi:MAG: hypothetical protein PHI53_00585 [Candidatus Pacebacteria bacterium]|nr:hypothetical protein [Candidatus Paceibacterota bacterium]
MERPSSVNRFEFLMYAALLISSVGAFVKYSSSSYGFNIALFVIPFLYTIIPFILVWVAAHLRQDWARWVVVILMGIGIIYIVPSLFLGFSYISRISVSGSEIGLMTIGLNLIQVILEIIAFCYIFSSASNKWFSSGMNEVSPNTDPAIPVVNQTWRKGILTTNIIFFLIYIGLIVGVDMPIVRSDPSLLGFLQIMYVVLAGFMVFFLLETFIFRKKFGTSASGIDSGIVTVIVLRNILFLLNFIPFIQLLGLAGLPTVGSILLIIYVILIIRRFNSLKVLRA